MLSLIAYACGMPVRLYLSAWGVYSVHLVVWCLAIPRFLMSCIVPHAFYVYKRKRLPEEDEGRQRE